MSDAFGRLHREIQHILWDMKWEKLRDLQVRAIGKWFDTDHDIVLMANTASGKTEAAFLPILSAIAQDKGAGSIRVMYVGPLKALINDQFRRLEELCKRAEIPVHRWNGDVPANRKKKLLKSPTGVLLITPESIEALLLRHGRDAHRLFGRLEAIVIDELHVFLDSERGRQLSSQMARIDKARGGNRARRIGLSATIGDPDLAAEWITDQVPEKADIIESLEAQDVELMLKTFLSTPEGASQEDESLESVAEHILEHFAGKTNLVFFNRKADIEVAADSLAQLCERARRPNEFLVHHGSLSKDMRHYTEEQLQSSRPCTALCSSSLELGIDVGTVDSIGQVEPPCSVSALKQRLGRSGRLEGQPSRLWLYVPCRKAHADDPLPDRLYLPLIQAIALVDLMLEKWVEPPYIHVQDMSTLVQQVLGIVVQKGGISASDAYGTLTAAHAFSFLDESTFADVLSSMGTADLIEQVPSGDLILGLVGERVTGHYSFYAAFESAETYQVVHRGREIGSIEAKEGSYQPGQFMLLAGKRWRIIDVDEERKELSVEPARGKQPVLWHGGKGHVHKRIREKMYELLVGDSVPFWLEPVSVRVLTWARSTFKELELSDRRYVSYGSATYLFTWTGSRANHTLGLVLRNEGVSGIGDLGVGLAFTSAPPTSEQVVEHLRSFVDVGPDPAGLVMDAFRGEPPPAGKFDNWLPPRLRAMSYASMHLDVPEACECARLILEQLLSQTR